MDIGNVRRNMYFMSKKIVFFLSSVQFHGGVLVRKNLFSHCTEGPISNLYIDGADINHLASAFMREQKTTVFYLYSII